MAKHRKVPPEAFHGVAIILAVATVMVFGLILVFAL
jgi:hypothetical protein